VISLFLNRRVFEQEIKRNVHERYRDVQNKCFLIFSYGELAKIEPSL